MQKRLLFIGFYLVCFSLAAFQAKPEPENQEIKRDSVWIETSNGQIFGVLFQPLNPEKSEIPAVLCLQGGGDVGLANYTYEAKFFARNGIAALVCDKSGAGRSKTKKSWTEQSFKDKTTEYFEILSWLSNYEGIDRSCVGVHGLSEGGRLALNMAIRSPEKIAFVNAVSGPLESFKDNQLYAIENYLKAQQQLDSAVIDKTLTVWDAYFDDVANGAISKTTIDKIKNLITLEPTLRYRPDTTGVLPSRPLSEDIHFTTEGNVDTITCPVLLQYGALDARVDPKASLSAIPQEPNFEVKVYEDTDHSMNLKNGKTNPLFLEDKLIWLQQAVLNKN